MGGRAQTRLLQVQKVTRGSHTLPPALGQTHGFDLARATDSKQTGRLTQRTGVDFNE